MNTTDHIRCKIASVLAGSLVIGFICETSVFVKSLSPNKSQPVAKRIEQVRKKCADEFPLRTGFVTLNGGFVRIIGQHFCNGVTRMEPGSVLIDHVTRRTAMIKAADNMSMFSGFCVSNGVKFLYVQLPKRMDSGRTMLPPGDTDESYDNADELMEAITRLGVDSVDLRPLYVATAEDVRRNFFRTDHHWTINTAFRDSGLLALEITMRLGEKVPDEAHLLTEERWMRETTTGVFLGSLGRRVGGLFAAKDDLVVLRPKFKTDMSMEIPERHWKRRGSFEETVMWRYAELRRVLSENAFGIDSYTSLYIGGLYSLVRHENLLAPINRKVLLIGDSFARPVEGFFSVVFRDLTFVDPRRCGSEFSLSAFILREKPDIVIQLLTSDSLVVGSFVGVKHGMPIMFEYGLSSEDSLLRDIAIVRKSKYFDCDWYLKQYADVAKAKMDPVRHYCKSGWKEGRRPGPNFDGRAYLATHPEVKKVSMNPLVHYERYGRK